MNLLKVKYLGQTVEIRDNKKVLVKTWEEVSPVTDEIENIDKNIAKLQDKKDTLSESI